MKAPLRLEWIGYKDDTHSMMDRPFRKPWVAEITGLWPSGKTRFRFLDGEMCFVDTNSVGSRGVRLLFILQSDILYRVKRHTSWRGGEQYYCAVNLDGDIVRVEEKDAIEWASAL